MKLNSANKNQIFITGGAGYIGSHLAFHAKDRGYEVTIYDNLSTGSWQNIASFSLITGDTRDNFKLSNSIANQQATTLVHLADIASVEAAKSNMKSSLDSNFEGLKSVLYAMKKNNSTKLIYISSCAVYGSSDKVKLDESSLIKPVSLYGKSKLLNEELIRKLCPSLGIDCVILRLFNAAGADLKMRTGESHDPETHIIPLALQAALGVRDFFPIYGTKYKTSDGSALRDYIHVADIAKAILMSIDYLNSNKGVFTFNVGSGQGYSVLEIIDQVKKITRKDFPIKIYPRRHGDALRLISDSSKARELLGWTAHFSQINFILKTAWDWENKKIPERFKSARGYVATF